MLQTMLSQEVMTKAAQRLMKLLPYKKHSDVIKRAWQLYRTGHVYNVTVENDVLKGKVTDRGHTYEPSFRLKQAAGSSCSCTTVGLCPHNVALFLYAYNQIDVVGNLIRQWKEPTAKQKHARQKHAKQKHAKQNNIQVSQQPAEQREKDMPPNGNIIEAWWDSFEKAYRRIPLYNITEEEQMRRLVHFFFEMFERPTAKKPFLDHLYYVHASLFTFMKMTRIPQQPWSYSAMMQERHVNQIVQSVQQAIKDLAKKPRTKLHEQLIYASIPYARNILSGELTYFTQILDVYKTIWNNLFTDPSYREEECNWAIKKLNEKETVEQKIPFIAAASYVSFLLENDHRAYQLIEPFPYLATEHIIDFMHTSFAKKQIQRGAEWFHRLEKNMESYLHSLHMTDRDWFVRTVLSAHSQYSIATKSDETERYEQLLQKLLPYSFYMYIDYLFDEQKWKKLTELYMLEKANVDMIPPYHLKSVEQADRSLALPLYHQTIMYYIEQKNRSAYEQAIKHLRKLRAHYRALKQMPRWEAYIIKLAEQTKRLRAFQDLLRKGKFI
ncbi:hypothetical protein LH47_02179 [Anoxybacillus thermarum]|uniref:SWIM-type domain-containing protein n=1 Tax=Anoxybacillus thermarum TaxID=404937 RepID=A0A0D0RWJ9_9BACL|nr:hypothetical protein [Anoxybacillus thermarum]KIQ93750.1 hypothetical protein LH47_02179 [Anoxybacillus thermarum]